MLPKALFLSTIEKIRQQEARIDEFDKALSKMAMVFLPSTRTISTCSHCAIC